MKQHYLLLVVIILSVSCMTEKAAEKSSLQFQNNGRTIASNTTSQLEQSGLALRIIDRYYVSSLLLDVFGPSAGQPVHDFIKIKMDNFGGGCDQYDYNVDTSTTCINEDCGKIWCSGTNVIDNQIGVSSVIRQGWTIRACEEIANSDSAILFALQNLLSQTGVTIATAPSPSTDTLAQAYSLFYRSTQANSAVITSLNTISMSETSSNFEKWRYIFLSVCTSPEWQIP